MSDIILLSPRIIWIFDKCMGRTSASNAAYLPLLYSSTFLPGYQFPSGQSSITEKEQLHFVKHLHECHNLLWRLQPAVHFHLDRVDFVFASPSFLATSLLEPTLDTKAEQNSFFSVCWELNVITPKWRIRKMRSLKRGRNLAYIQSLDQEEGFLLLIWNKIDAIRMILKVIRKDGNSENIVIQVSFI